MGLIRFYFQQQNQCLVHSQWSSLLVFGMHQIPFQQKHSTCSPQIQINTLDKHYLHDFLTHGRQLQKRWATESKRLCKGTLKRVKTIIKHCAFFPFSEEFWTFRNYKICTLIFWNLVFGINFLKTSRVFRVCRLFLSVILLGLILLLVFFPDSAWVTDHCSPGIRINESSGGRYRNVFRRYQLWQ